MQAMPLLCSSALLGLFLTGCSREASPLRHIEVQQNWALQAGTQIAGYRISSGLGDISVDLSGDAIQMPFDGEVYPAPNDCVLLSSPEVPAYLFRLCGVKRVRLGARSHAQTIGYAHQLVFAALRRQPDGTWVLVEPSAKLIEQFVAQPQ